MLNSMNLEEAYKKAFEMLTVRYRAGRDSSPLVHDANKFLARTGYVGHKTGDARAWACYGDTEEEAINKVKAAFTLEALEKDLKFYNIVIDDDMEVDSAE
jgi:hypothetical protein